MAQDALGPINPATTSGSQLASRLNNFWDSLKSSFSGTSRPTWAGEGTVYLNKTVSPPVLMICGAAIDGSQDVPLITFVKATQNQIDIYDDNGFPQKSSIAQLMALLTVALGASGVADGAVGLVPKPLMGQQDRFLRGDMTYALPDNARFPIVTISVDTTLTASALTKLHLVTAQKTIKLPSGAELSEGDFIDFEGGFGGTATIQRADTTTDLIDGATTKTLFAYMQLRLEWTGSSWKTCRQLIGVQRDLNKQAGDYTFKATDAERLVVGTSSTLQTFTIPLLANEPGIGQGTQIDLLRIGSGDLAIAPAVGVTLNPAATRKINAQYQSAVLIATSDNIWTLAGSLKA